MPQAWLSVRTSSKLSLDKTTKSIATFFKASPTILPQHRNCLLFHHVFLPALSPSVGWLGGKSFCFISRSLGRLFKSAGLRNFRSKNPGFFFSTPLLVCSRRWWYLHKVMDDGAAVAAIAAPLWSSGKKEKLNNGLPKVSCTHIVNTVNERVYLKEVNAYNMDWIIQTLQLCIFFK